MGTLACALAALALAGSGQDGKMMETVLQDDAVFLHRAPAEVQRSADLVAGLGADRLRLTAGWSALAPKPGAKEVPGAGFDADDPATYEQDRFRALDTAVKAADKAGLGVQLDLAFWAPRWATRLRSKNPLRQRTFPVAERFGEFAEAVARRYSGAFRDPHGDGRLPRVSVWTTWNEPNHPSFLHPQWAGDGRGGFRPMSPHVYRAMHDSAYDALKRVHLGNQVLMGATASTGSTTPGRGGVPPLLFLRTMACVDDRLRPLRVRECRGFRPLRADGFSHHPYSRYTTPGTSSPFADDAPIADTGRLTGLLEQLAQRGRIVGRLPVWHTEFGYETREDDPFNAPFSRADQARFLGWSTYLAYKQRDVRAMAQFLLRDVDPAESGRPAGTRGHFRDWQSGLLDHRGRPKPALAAFKLPFWVEVTGEGDARSVTLFGQVRPGSGRQAVLVERQDPASGAWQPIATAGPRCDEGDPTRFLTDRHGFFLRTAPFDGPGTYRLAWTRGDGVVEHGVPVELEPPGSPLL